MNNFKNIKDMNELKNIEELFDYALTETILARKDSPFDINKIKKGDLKLLFVLGDNASGKSFITENILSLANNKLNWKGIPIGMRLRTRSGLSRMFLADDQSFSTGAGSISNTLRSLEQLLPPIRNQNRKIEDKVLLLDEPTIGVSSRFKKAFSDQISYMLKEIIQDENNRGVIIVSHSKKFIKYIMDNGADFTCYSMSQNYKSIEDWFSDDSDATIEELLNLKRKTHDKFREICKFLETK